MGMEDDGTKFGEYTRWPERKTFKEEREMVRNAIEKDGKEKIMKYLEPLIQYWAKDFKVNQPQIKLTGEEFLEAGFTYLELGLKKYYEKLETGKVGFKFSTYFEWFIRQGIVEYLKSRENNSKSLT